MPDGRMLAKSIAWSEQVGSVSMDADYLFMRMIPHLDCAGRMVGSPKAVKAMCCPLRDEMTPKKVERALRELADAGLILWYTVDGHQYIAFPRFETHQRGARLDREAPSRIPPHSGNSAEVVRTTSGPAEEEVRASKVKLSEVKESEVHGTSPDVPSVSSEPYARTDYPADFEAFWQAYPADARGTKKTAFKAYRARQRDGHTAEIIAAGLVRYAAFLAATGRYAKQASTFVGPDLHFLEPWEIPRGAGPPENAAQKAEREAGERRHRAMLVSSRKSKSDGDSWWDRMMRESAAVNQNVWDYAFHHREEVA